MKLRFEIPDSLAAWLQATAAEKGLDIETCCIQLLETHVREGAPRTKTPPPGDDPPKG